MEKQQIFSKVNFAPFGGKGGKLVLMAKDYNFELETYSMQVGEDRKKSFSHESSLELTMQDLYKVSKSMFMPYMENFNRVRFKLKELTLPHTFANFKLVFSNLYAITLTGEYVAGDNGTRNRITKLAFYKFETWDHKKDFYNGADMSSFMIGSYQFDSSLIAKGSYVGTDTSEVDEIISYIADLNFKRNISYVEFLKRVHEAENKPKEETTPKTQSTQTTQTTSQSSSNGWDDNEFPF